jgi:hypothetical protein
VRRAAVVAALTAGALALAGPAAAFWRLTSTPSDATHPVAQLSAPQNLTASASVVEHAGVVDLSWQPPAAPAGATAFAYEVVRAGAVVCRTATTTCRETGLRTGTTATYDVRALLGLWRGPASRLDVVVPDDLRLLVTAPATAVVGTPFSVSLVALNGTAPDTTAVGTRTLLVSGASSTATASPTSSVQVSFATQPDGSVTGTATVTLVAEETVTLLLRDSAAAREGTSAPVAVGRQGSMAFADCRGPAGYSCGSRTKLNGTPVSAVVVRATADSAGALLPLPAATVTLTLNNDRKGTLDRVTVTFAEGATTSERFTFLPEPTANGNVQVSVTAAPGQTAPAPLVLAL